MMRLPGKKGHLQSRDTQVGILVSTRNQKSRGQPVISYKYRYKLRVIIILDPATEQLTLFYVFPRVLLPLAACET